MPAGCFILGHLTVTLPWKGRLLAGAVCSPIVPFLESRCQREEGSLKGEGFWVDGNISVERISIRYGCIQVLCQCHQDSASPFLTSVFPLGASRPGSLSPRGGTGLSSPQLSL